MSRKRNENQLGLFDAPAPLKKVVGARDKEKAREWNAANAEKIRDAQRKC